MQAPVSRSRAIEPNVSVILVGPEPRDVSAPLAGLGPASECIVVEPGDEGRLLGALRGAKCEIVAVAWSHGRHPLERIPELVAPIAAGGADVVVGRRRGWLGLAGSVARLVAGALSGIADPLSGFVAARRECVDRLDGPVAAC